jgi:hypothetical protein
VLIGGSDVTVRHNTFTNLMSHSYDYIWDGAAVEFYGAVSNVLVHGNYIENVNAFTEVGGRSTDLVSGLSFDHNIIVNSESLAYFHNGGGDFGLGGIQNVNFVYNTVYSDRNLSDSNSFAFAFGGTTGNFLNVKNNIFKIAGLDSWDLNATDYTHANNLYDFAAGSIPFRETYFTGEYQSYASFADAAARNFHLTSGSSALGLAAPINGFLSDYLDHSSRAGMDIGAVEYWV